MQEMELLRQKTLMLGIITIRNPGILGNDDDAESSPQLQLMPAYLVTIHGVRCGIVYHAVQWDHWAIIDVEYGVTLGDEYRYFADVGAAVRDDAWIAEKHNEIEAEYSKLESAATELFNVDVPLRGQPSIALIPRFTTGNSDLAEDATDVIEEQMEEAERQLEALEGDEFDDQPAADENDSSATFTVTEHAQIENDHDDEDESDVDQEEINDIMLEPTAAYIAPIGKHPVAFFALFTEGPVAWWEALDISFGLTLWQSPSLTELIRIAPLMIPIVTGHEDLPLDTVLYVNALVESLSDAAPNAVQKYLETGNLRLNGGQYLRVLKTLFVDRGDADSIEYWEARDPEVLDTDDTLVP